MPRPARPLAALVAAGAALAVVPASAHSEPLVGVDTSDRLVTFDSATPTAVKRRAITGLGAGEEVVGLDRRPANGTLVAVTDAGRLYTVSATSGRAAAIGQGPFSPGIDGAAVGFDFNPTVDRIRLVTSNAQDLRLVPDTGAVGAVDGTLAYKEGDPGAGTAPFASASAYTNSVADATTTQLFNIDAGRDTLVLQAPPNDGVLGTVGALGPNVAGPIAFDISGRTGLALMSSRLPRVKGSRLFRVDLETGRASRVGIVGGGRNPVTLVGLTFRR